MGLLDRIRACQRHDLAHFRPFGIGGRRVGWVKPDVARVLLAHPDVFAGGEDGVHLHPRHRTFAERTEAMGDAVRRLHADGLVAEIRDEPFPVAESWGREVLLRLDRGAVPLFGVPAYGVHVNGWVQASQGLSMWLGRRARTSRTDPGKLDNVVAGGQPFGISLRDNLVKEAAEEASIPEEVARRAVSVGAVSYRLETPGGLKNDTLFAYDLELPTDFVPANRDGEVEGFELWPVERVLERVRRADDFKFNVPLVLIDFFVRRGVLDPDREPEYAEIVRRLRNEGSPP